MSTAQRSRQRALVARKRAAAPQRAPVAKGKAPPPPSSLDVAPVAPVSAETPHWAMAPASPFGIGVQRAAAPPAAADERKEKKKEDAPAPVRRAERRREKKEGETIDDRLKDAPVQKAPAAAREPTAEMDEVAARAIREHGEGAPLEDSTRRALEPKLGADLSGVRVHDDIAARDAAADIDARAFTHGQDIWLGPGETQSDVGLMAHEATHVLQQAGEVHRLVQRQPGGGGGATPPTAGASAEGGPPSPGEAERKLKTFPIPQVKARHRHLYEVWASSHRLIRAAGYSRGNPQQKENVWLPAVTVTNTARLHAVQLDAPFTGERSIRLRPGGSVITGTYQTLLDRVKVPNWDRQGRVYRSSMEVDHVVELQGAGWPSSAAGNQLENMELLDKSANASSGSLIMNQIRRNTRDYLQALGRPHSTQDADDYLTSTAVEFERVEINSGGRPEAGTAYWTKEEIRAGAHLEAARPGPNPVGAGSATSFALLSPGGAIVLGEFPHGQEELIIAVTDPIRRRCLAGLDIATISLNNGYQNVTAGSPIGSLTVRWDLPTSAFEIPAEPVTIPLVRAQTQYGGVVGTIPAPQINFRKMSAITFGAVTFEDGQIAATGRLLPSIPLFAGIPLEVHLRGGNVEIAYVFRPQELTLPVPGLTIDDASIGVFFGTAGFGVEGGLEFTIRNMGRGGLDARPDSTGGFALSGFLEFDTNLFDRARVEAWYRHGAFGGRGTLAITTPGKVRGIRSAQVTASYDRGTFTATGTVAPSIPGVREASLTVSRSDEEGLSISGTLTLADNIPGIQSGSLEARVVKPPGGERWLVSAHGTAVPRIPGVSTSLTIDYNDGAFDINGTADYNRGMLSGSVTIGATNRPIGEDGRPSGPPAEHAEHVTLYGGGRLTLRLAPWLQATAGIRLLPNGEIEVSGEIGLPAALDLFPEKRFDRNLITIGIDIPIVGVAVAGQRIGIFANISGGLDLSAGIGPGQLQELRLGVTYNAAHEDQTRITGGARLHIPAHAGLRLFVRGALGVGIPIVSAQAGIELGGSLGIEGALDAGVQVSWSPSTGLDITAAAEIHAEPKFRFDITGFVLVEADLVLTTVELYSKRWQLASFEYGSGLRLGLRFPIHYHEGAPFDVSLNDVQFDVPQVDPGAMLRGLLERIA